LQVQGFDRGEVAVVERDDGGRADSFCEGDHGRGCSAEREASVRVYKFGHTIEVFGRGTLDVKASEAA
jgi:hypothetical protein